MTDRIDHAAEAQKVLAMPTSVWGSPSDVLAGAQVHATRTEGEFDRWLAAHDGAIREQIAARIEAEPPEYFSATMISKALAAEIARGEA